jgi:hypothetical protein
MTSNNKNKGRQRLPRFERAKNINFRLQDRDIEIIKEVHKYRFLNSDHIISLVGESRRILNRLRLLFHAGYLDRPKAQKQLRNEKMVYALGNKGAELLSRQFTYELPTTDWTTKNREAGPAFLDHTLMIADFVIMVRVACEKLEGLWYIEPESIINHRPQPAKAENPMSWKIEVRGDKNKYSVGIIPDYVFGIYDEHAGRTFYCFLEADRSTMPIKRSGFRKSSYYKKLVGYYETMKQNQFPAIWGFKSARILTLTLSQERIKSMIAANKEADPRQTGTRMFYFTLAKSFSVNDSAKIFDKIWLNGREEWCSLLD